MSGLFATKVPASATADSVADGEANVTKIPAEANATSSSPAPAPKSQAGAALEPGTERQNLARELNKELQQAARQRTEQEDQAAELWSQFESKTQAGALSHDGVEQFLQKINDGKRPSNADVQFFWRSVKGSASGAEAFLSKDEFMSSLRAWETYKKYREDIELLFFLYDMNGNGRLNTSEVQFLLEEMRGYPVDNEELASVLKSASCISEETVSRMEVAVIIARWHGSPAYVSYTSTLLRGRGYRQCWGPCDGRPAGCVVT
eukprot:gnl/TRDRNA2_/TRDRNA2_58411_c0_seq1.p1 gnl/TRDRNA2_/TRDRNA2_58411_c0~~gnl/TRDRNA2_/TRDRNA2_58411_c0_seq1.p1  ORF type:complete len:262 (+),score=55.54 gnl/TRDRNA2_/TRDRNA2_58411_c0_seq1:52-837(+)